MMTSFTLEYNYMDVVRNYALLCVIEAQYCGYNNTIIGIQTVIILQSLPCAVNLNQTFLKLSIFIYTRFHKQVLK